MLPLSLRIQIKPSTDSPYHAVRIRSSHVSWLRLLNIELLSRARSPSVKMETNAMSFALCPPTDGQTDADVCVVGGKVCPVRACLSV